MPIYEFSCQKCGAQFELLVRRTTELACPECNNTSLERLMSLPRVQSSVTRKKSMRAAKKRDASLARDRMHDRLQYEKSHDRHG